MKSFKSKLPSVLNFLYISTLYPIIIGTPKNFTVWNKIVYSLFSGFLTFIFIQIFIMAIKKD